MRTGGYRRHDAPGLLSRTASNVNSRAFFVGATARSVAAELLLDKTDNDRFDQVGGNPRDAQKKTGFQQAAASFACAFWSDVDLSLASNDGRHEKSERDRAYDPRHRFTPDRATNFSRQVGFFANANEPSLHRLTRSLDLFSQFRGWFASRFFSHSRSFFNSAAVSRNTGRLIPVPATNRKISAMTKCRAAAASATHNHETFAIRETATTAVASRKM